MPVEEMITNYCRDKSPELTHSFEQTRGLPSCQYLYNKPSWYTLPFHLLTAIVVIMIINSEARKKNIERNSKSYLVVMVKWHRIK